jgi:hypothetical protein
MLGSNPDFLVFFGSPGEFVCKANDFLWPLLLVEGGGGEDVRFKSRLLSFIWLPGRDLNPLPSLKFSLLKGKLLAVSPQRSPSPLRKKHCSTQVKTCRYGEIILKWKFEDSSRDYALKWQSERQQCFRRKSLTNSPLKRARTALSP